MKSSANHELRKLVHKQWPLGVFESELSDIVQWPENTGAQVELGWDGYWARERRIA